MPIAGLYASLANLSIYALREARSCTPSSLSLLLRVIALPLRLNVREVTTGTGILFPIPRLMARGIPVTIWAASKRPSRIPSARSFQLFSLESVTSRPYLANNPFSWAIAKGAQSVRGI